MSEPLKFVYFEETGERRGVLRGCLLCGVTEENIRANEFILSPSGVAHSTDGYENTTCGKDGTGEKWWWPL